MSLKSVNYFVFGDINQHNGNAWGFGFANPLKISSPWMDLATMALRILHISKDPKYLSEYTGSLRIRCCHKILAPLSQFWKYDSYDNWDWFVLRENILTLDSKLCVLTEPSVTPLKSAWPRLLKKRSKLSSKIPLVASSKFPLVWPSATPTDQSSTLQSLLGAPTELPSLSNLPSLLGLPLISPTEEPMVIRTSTVGSENEYYDDLFENSQYFSFLFYQAS